MNGTVAITDHGWYQFLLAQDDLDEVNFWTPSAHWGFRGEVGAPFFFKLKAQYDHAICGFAHFARYSRLPDWLAWETFGAPPKAIQELAGHADLTMTQRYMHLSPAALDAAIGLLERPSGDQSCGDILATGSPLQK